MPSHTVCIHCKKKFKNRVQLAGPFSAVLGIMPDWCPHCGGFRLLETTILPADFKFSHVSSASRTYANLKIKHKEIAKVAEAFEMNMDRVFAIGLLPEMMLFQWAWRLQSASELELSILHLAREDAKTAVQMMKRFLFRIDDLLTFVPNEGMHFGVEAVFFAMIQGAWTAFETLAADLWEAAINSCPQSLFKLDGEEKRIERIVTDRIEEDKRLASGGKRPKKARRPPAESIVAKDERESKKVDLLQIGKVSGDTFNLGNKMGSLLRTKYEFTTLRKIRAAYGLAFSPPVQAIDDVLSCRAIDALCAVRNVIVHKAGVADEEYLEKIDGIPNAPPLALGQKLALDGESTFNLIDLVVSQEISLLKAVDEFLRPVRGTKCVSK